MEKDYKLNTEMEREKEKKAFDSHAYSFVICSKVVFSSRLDKSQLKIVVKTSF